MNGAPRSFTWDTSLPERATEYAFVPRIWATRGIGFLLDQIRLNGESSELRDEVTLLAAHPEAAPWLALGRNVRVVLGGEIVEVVE